MMEEKVRKGILRSQYWAICEPFKISREARLWSTYDDKYCDKEYLQYKKDSEIANNLLGGIIENMAKNGSLDNWMDKFLTQIWEEPTLEEEPTTTTVGSTTEEWYVTYDLFGKRRKRELTLSHKFNNPPNERYLKMENINKTNQPWLMDKEVRFNHT